MVHIPGWSGPSKQITAPQPQTKSFNGNVLPGLIASTKLAYDGVVDARTLWNMHKDDQANLAAFSENADPIVGTPVQRTEAEEAIAAQPQYAGISEKSMQSVIQAHRRNTQNVAPKATLVDTDFDSMSEKGSLDADGIDAPKGPLPNEAPKRTLPKGKMLAVQVTLCAVQILGGSAGMVHSARRLWN